MNHRLALVALISLAACSQPPAHGPGAVVPPAVTAASPRTEQAYLYVALPNSVVVYDANGTVVRTITSGISGISYPNGIALDSKGYLYVANQQTVTIYAPGSSSLLRTLQAPQSPGQQYPGAFAFDQAGDLYVGYHGGTCCGSIGVYSPQGVQQLYSITSGVSYPNALGIGHDGTLYVGNENGSGVSYVDTFAPSSTSGTFLFQLGAPTAIAFDRSGDVYFANVLHHGKGTDVPIYSPSSSKVIGVLGVANSTGLAFSRAGNLFIPSATANTVTIVAHSYGRVLNTIKAGISFPIGVVLDQYNNVYVLNYGNNTITVYAPGHLRPMRTISEGSNVAAAIAIGTI